MKTYLEPSEIALLENAATNLRDRLLVRLLFHLGCRVSEALALSVTDVNLEQSTVTILHLKTRLNLNCPQCNAKLGKAHIFCPKCGTKVEDTVEQLREHRRMRTLPLDSDTLEMLRDYIERDGPVFRDGKHLIFGINRHRVWQVVKECAEKAGLPDLVNPETGRMHGVSPHRLRDAFAVMAVQQDDSTDGVRMLQEHLGHESFNTTAKYRKVAGGEHRDWYQKLWQKEGTGGASP